MTPQTIIRVNQVGYASNLPVHIAVLGDGPLIVRDEAGREFRRLDTLSPAPDEASGDTVALVDLGTLPEGRYVVLCGNTKRKITVSRAPWQDVARALIKGFYYQRCGCALRKEYAGPWVHGPCHTAPAADWEDPSRRRPVTGGWHDAGDYGKYVGPGAVTVAHLMYAWKLFPQGCSEALNIPETGNGVPNILNEARYELEWMLKMQRPDGAFHHKLTKARFAPFILPEEDRKQEYLMPVSHCATAAACACLALASRVYRIVDSVFADTMLAAAGHAWAWLLEHPDFVPFFNPEGVRTGMYGDRSDRDERFWAACELYAATGEEAYRTAAESLYGDGLILTEFGCTNVGGLGALCCLFDLLEKAGDILYGKLRADFLRQTEEVLSVCRASGYGTALEAGRYVWGSILPILSRGMAMILHSLLTGREDMRAAALVQWDYALGLNALDKCFVTGFGENPVRNPHHRPSAADGVDAPVPGLVSGGPNKRMPYPSTRERLGDGVPPAKYFLDETPSADTNEIAIYWNSPAVFVSAYFQTLSQQ